MAMILDDLNWRQMVLENYNDKSNFVLLENNKIGSIKKPTSSGIIFDV